MVAWGPIIGAGISALGSLFGGDDDEETTTTIDYRKMAREAERAGFNPLTAIRNGGSAGFTTTTHPGLSMADRFGQAFQTIGNALASFDARADERADLELRIQRAELERIQKANLGGQRMSFDAPHASGSTRSNSSARAGTGVGAPTPTVSGAQNRTATNPFPTDSGIVIDTNVSDAEAWTTRYGEAGEWVGGISAADADWQKNRPPPPITDEVVDRYRKKILKVLNGTTAGGALRHWNLPSNRGW